MWSPALARGLIRHDALRSIRHCDGYTDLLGQNTPIRPTLMQRVKQSQTVAAIYEACRPIMMTAHGRSMSAERERAAAALHLVGEQRVLDMACGPGDPDQLHRHKLDGDGFVIGLDNSLRMIERAVDDNSAARAVYMRAEALSPPFDDGAFDAVCCFAPPPGGRADRRAPRDGAGTRAGRTNRGTDELRPRIRFGAQGNRSRRHDLRRPRLRPNHGSGVLCRRRVDRHRPTTARDLSVRHSTTTRPGHRTRTLAHPNIWAQRRTGSDLIAPVLVDPRLWPQCPRRRSTSIATPHTVRRGEPRTP